MPKESPFDRFVDDIKAGRKPAAADIRTLERRAAALRNHYPTKILKLQLKLRSLRTKFARKQRELELAEKIFIQDVTMARDESTGKPIFSNTELRKIEVERRKTSCPKFSVLSREHAKLELEVDNANILLDHTRAASYAWRDMFAVQLNNPEK